MEALDPKLLKAAVEAALLAAGQPLSVAQLGELFPEAQRPNHTELAQALEALARECADRGIELKEVASGFRFQVNALLARLDGNAGLDRLSPADHAW